jgi:predicted HTH domain antitoxin
MALEEAMPKSLTLRIPESLARKLDCMGEDLLIDLLERGLREFKIEQALERYRRGGISFGAAVRQAGVSRSEFDRPAYARGTEPPFSTETLGEELG